MLGRGQLLDEHQSLYTGIEVGRVCNPEQSVKMLLQGRIVRCGKRYCSVYACQDRRDQLLCLVGFVRLGSCWLAFALLRRLAVLAWLALLLELLKLLALILLLSLLSVVTQALQIT